MLVGFDTEYGFSNVNRQPNGKLHGDTSTMRPVCACLYFEDGRELKVADNFDQIEPYFSDHRYTVLVHGRMPSGDSASVWAYGSHPCSGTHF